VASADWLRAISGAVELEILVVPRASRTQIAGVHDGRLKIQLSAPPVDGAANAALCAFLAERLGVKKSAVAIASGETSKRKRVRVSGVGPDDVIGLASD
jgi:uncharacterized protein (TIGR00251 family)